jgi:hypothetical protein
MQVNKKRKGWEMIRIMHPMKSRKWIESKTMGEGVRCKEIGWCCGRLPLQRFVGF